MLKDPLNKLITNGALGVSLVFGLFLGIALLSFNINDGGYSSSYGENIHNVFGNFGAFSADFLFSIFGISAYLIPLGILYILILKLYIQNTHLKTNKYLLSFATLGLFILVLAISLLSGIFFAEPSSKLPFSWGGILGLNLAYFLRTSISTPISILVAFILLLVGISNVFRFSWLTLMDDLGAFVIRFLFGKKSSASSFLNTKLDDDSNAYEPEVEFDREACFSQPLFDSDGELVNDDKSNLDMRDAHEFLHSTEDIAQTQSSIYRETKKSERANQADPNKGDVLDKFLANSQHIGTFTTGVPLSSVTQLDLAKADIEAVKKVIDEAVGFEYEAISASDNSLNYDNQDEDNLSDEAILSQKLDKFDSEFRFDEIDDKVDFEFPDDFFSSQEQELNKKLTTKDADLLLEQVENGELGDLHIKDSQAFSAIENHEAEVPLPSKEIKDKFITQKTPLAREHSFFAVEQIQEAKGIDDLTLEKATSTLALKAENFSRDLAEEDDSSVDFEFNARQEPKLDEHYVTDKFNYEPKLEGAIMDRKTPPNFDQMSEDDKKAIKEPREFGYLNKSVPDADKMQDDADKLYRAIVQPREYGYIEEPVESLDRLQKDTDNLYRAVSQPREYGYIEEPVNQLTKIQEIADKLYKAVSEPREHGFMDEPVEQLSKLQARIDQLYTAITKPREYGYLADTVPQIAQLQAYADELYTAITQPREHGYLEETVPQVQKLQDDIDKLYLAVSQPREHGFIDEPVDSLTKVQQDTDDVINAVRGGAGKKPNAVDEISADNSQEESGHLPQQKQNKNFHNSTIKVKQNADGARERELLAPSGDFSQEIFTKNNAVTDLEQVQTKRDLSDYELQRAIDKKTQPQAPVDFEQMPKNLQEDSEQLQNFLESSPNIESTTQVEEQNLAINEREEEEEEEQKVWRVSDFQIKQAHIEGELLGAGALPSLDILDETQNLEETFSAEEQDELIFALKQGLEEFGVSCDVVEVLPGPVVTRFELELAAGVKSSKVSALDKDIARALKVPSVMVVEVTPGKSTVGVEIPNKHRSIISLRKQFASKKFKKTDYALPLALGEDISGESQVANLAKMPHLLVAGTTGSGKSVAINAMLLSLLYKLEADELRLILIDPKMLELAVYQGIPHLLAPVVTDMKQAANALNWCVGEMEERYKLMAAMGVKNIDGYNKRLAQAEAQDAKVLNPLDEDLYLEKMPFIVVVIDEFNDLMITVGKKVEELIARLAQKARASGIHLVLATQRPSVDVITGLIKANIPARIGFQVSTKIDSRTILDTSGADQLLGNGDSLYLSGTQPLPIRIHGAYVSDDEVYRVAEDWRRRGEPNYIDGVLTGESREKSSVALDIDSNEEQDELYDQVVEFVIESGRPSASAIQRRFSIGYPRAARLIDTMEANGLISALQSNGKREILSH